MASFRDLEPIFYHDGPHDADRWQCPLLAVGWLEQGDTFPTGPCPPHVIERLIELRHQFREAFPAYSFRGLHGCSLCGNGADPLNDSHINLFIPGAGVLYDATGRVDHHIEVHSYLPPSGFIDAVLCCPDPRTEEYVAALFLLNSGKRPPFIPEAWNTFEVDENGTRARRGGYENEADAQKYAIFLARKHGKVCKVEQAPDRWSTYLSETLR